jgi:hypothetical protein
MNEFQREDVIISISGTIEKNHCAIKREDLFKKYKNTNRDDLKNILEIMKKRGTLRYDAARDKYRLIL